MRLTMHGSKQNKAISAVLWHKIEPLLPPRAAPSPKGGRPRVSDQAALNGIVFVLRTGIPMRCLPSGASAVDRAAGLESCMPTRATILRVVECASNASASRIASTFMWPCFPWRAALSASGDWSRFVRRSKPRHRAARPSLARRFFHVWCWRCICAKCLQMAYKQQKTKNPAIF